MDYKIVKADDHWFRENINCQYACPVNTPAMNYIERIVSGDFDASLRLNFMANLFPHILGRVCTHPCETACRRGAIDKPISICALKRSAAEFASKKSPVKPMHKEKTGRRVAIIGSGPSGLAAAHDLAFKGHDIVIYEALPLAGGMLSVGIPPYRLPRDKIEDAVNWIKELGVDIRLNNPIDTPNKFDTLLKEYNVIYLAAGAHKSQLLDIPGEDLAGVMHGVTFTKNTNLGIIKDVPGKIAVIGGGFTAIDCARSSLRLGAKEVSIVYRRTLEEMPAGETEVSMAEEEGIKMHYLTSPVKIIGGHDRKVTHLECIKNKLGEPDEKGRRRPIPIKGSNFIIPVDMIIAAIGQSPDIGFLSERFGIKINHWGMPVIDPESFMTARKGVFAGGDCVTGPRNIIEVVSDGRKAARSIHTFLTGEERKGYTFYYKDQTPSERMPNYESVPRQCQDALPMKERWNLNAEAELGLSRENTFKEAERCLLCHYNIFIDEKCVLCGGCIDICPYDCISMVSRENVETTDTLRDESTVPGDWDAVMVIDEEKCIRCGLCVKRCPVNAITMRRFAYSEE
ncbi:MAG: 4Fe-4S dicluster domain-containing protein [Candidatus Brocadia sp. AMX2]|uniref:NAD(P) oxidoreductase FAD-containing subunit n=1 Tax=Candidatus Brocadia sinica JPN1 TaxID=1197129 RepID=A0ABQ0JY49_9BACT|nr:MULTISPECIES: FAD-dependent oxidoreductase [Brocadia]KXK29969.1 MAG: NAD(P) oxidoreductase [Candidatus Brocadia sinica]MBC6931412.1 4Fe-4S dicluster domain-containing protein [Candidatus Brocadia sp.]MBL1167532.1 4Fe-4S dicluster domain-containing protein [Candidatus Brocadia sp. AMX1]NOG40579.1 FAD-dependent oxidoreductase [Planctomycetota bacterium]KAA0244142.1 MAG: 4Fe-4S dicluster domain-containing protein [Candidatus Brocadia sp. AMX2]